MIVFVCLLHKFRGLLCLGIDALIVAVILLAPYLVLSNAELVASMLSDSASLIAPLIAVLTARLGVYLIVLTIVGILFIAGYITYTVLAKKKALAAAAADDALPNNATAESLPASIETVEVTETTEPAPAEDIE